MYDKPYVELNNGIKMPIVGLGTWNLGTWQSTHSDTEAAVTAALDEGYRHIDTAYLYKNETAIGNALQKYFQTGKLKREDIFIVTKLPNFGLHKEDVETYLRRSLERLKLDYVDLYLVHTPIGVHKNEQEIPFPRGPDNKTILDKTTDLLETWKAMESLVDLKLTRSIGVSNFNSKQIQKIVDNCRIKPVQNQIECHAYFPQNELFEFCKNRGITICAYGPLGNPSLNDIRKAQGFQVPENPNLLTDKALEPLCKKHNKTAAQVLLRWLMQRGMVVIPKSANLQRIKENIQVFDFKLDDEDVKVINSLDRKLRLFNFPSTLGLEEHPEFPLLEAF